MTTNPPEDPFLPQDAASDNPATEPAPPLAPGLIATPGAATTPGAPVPPPPPLAPMQAPPLGGFVQSGWEPTRPSGLAVAAIVLTGVYTLVQLVSALGSQASVDAAKEALESGELTGDPLSTAMQLLSSVAGIAAFVVLALWMSRIRSNLAKKGVTAGGPPHVEWWGWFVPLAQFVLPLLGMRAIAHRKVGMGMLLGWWIPFCLVWVTTLAASVVSFAAIDFTTGELTNPEVLDSQVSLSYVAAAAVIVSWVFLTAIIRRITARHLEI